jgi:hypothetical protein
MWGETTKLFFPFQGFNICTFTCTTLHFQFQSPSILDVNCIIYLTMQTWYLGISSSNVILLLCVHSISLLLFLVPFEHHMNNLFFSTTHQSLYLTCIIETVLSSWKVAMRPFSVKSQTVNKFVFVDHMVIVTPYYCSDEVVRKKQINKSARSCVYISKTLQIHENWVMIFSSPTPINFSFPYSLIHVLVEIFSRWTSEKIPSTLNP